MLKSLNKNHVYTYMDSSTQYKIKKVVKLRGYVHTEIKYESVDILGDLQPPDWDLSGILD